MHLPEPPACWSARCSSEQAGCPAPTAWSPGWASRLCRRGTGSWSCTWPRTFASPAWGRRQTACSTGHKSPGPGIAAIEMRLSCFFFDLFKSYSLHTSAFIYRFQPSYMPKRNKIDWIWIQWELNWFEFEFNSFALCTVLNVYTYDLSAAPFKVKPWYTYLRTAWPELYYVYCSRTVKYSNIGTFPHSQRHVCS